MNKRTQLLVVVLVIIQSLTIIVLEYRLRDSATTPEPVVRGGTGTVCTKVADHTWDCRSVTVTG